MKETKFLKLSLSLLLALTLASCSDSDNGGSQSTQPKIEGTVAEVNSYGQLVTSFTPAQMKEAGLDYADLMHVTLADTIELTGVPFLTSFNEGKMFTPLFVDYNARGDDFGLGVLSSDMHNLVGGHAGDKVKLTLEKKAGYKEDYDLLKSVFPTERREGETAEVYANFRPITTTGMAQGLVYRSSNPLNCKNNPGRYAVVDSLAHVAGIRTELDLADTDAAVEKYMATEGYAATYCPQLFAQGRTLCMGLSVELFGSRFKQTMAQMARFMLSHEGPYLVHCNEGKDRCGFVSLLLEALAGATVDELRSDYMLTMINYYKISNGDASYQLRQRISADRMLWMLCHPEAASNMLHVNWDNTTAEVSALTPTTLQQAVRVYLQEGGLTATECDQLEAILQGKAHAVEQGESAL